MKHLPRNLYYTQHGTTVLRYWQNNGKSACRETPYPAALLSCPPDPSASVRPGVLETPRAVMFEAFRGLPLAPTGDWTLGPDGFSPLYRNVFAALLRMLRLPPEQRWCVRGEPGWFLQFGLHETDGSYTLGAFILPCGKPAVLTFRSADLLDALPSETPFVAMDITSASDGLSEQTDERMGWDTRIRLPIADNGAALIRLRPRYDI